MESKKEDRPLGEKVETDAQQAEKEVKNLVKEAKEHGQELKEDVKGAAGRVRDKMESKKEDLGETMQAGAQKAKELGQKSIEYVKRIAGKFHLLIACTGSVASIKFPEMIPEIRRHCGQHSSNVLIRVMATENAMRFFDGEAVAGLNDGIPVITDEDEWTTWKQRGDPVLHIELRKWADLMLIAPLDANTLAKIANGMCDNLVTCVVRAWDPEKPLYFAPAMNTYMWDNPITSKQVETLRRLLGYKEIPCIKKPLMCGDEGFGAMATLPMIGSVIAGEVKKHFAVEMRRAFQEKDLATLTRLATEMSEEEFSTQKYLSGLWVPGGGTDANEQ